MGGSFKWASTLAVALTSAALLTACGDGEDTSTTTTDSGKVSPQSASFQKYSGKGPAKLHIAEFGTEAAAEDRLEAQATIDAYLKAGAAGRWSEACRYVSVILLSQIKEIAEQSKEPVKPGCAQILPAMIHSANEQSGESRVFPSQGIVSLRIKEGPGGGFALFHGKDGRDHWMAVRREGEGWKVLSPTTQPFL